MIDSWCDLLGLNKFVTFVRTNVKMIETELRKRIGEGFHIFMAGGIRQQLLKKEVHKNLKIIFCLLEKEHFCKILGNVIL